MSTLISMFDALCISLASRCMLEQAMGEVAIRNGGIESFIMNMGSVKDNNTDVEYLGHQLFLLGLTKYKSPISAKKEQNY